MSAQLSDLAAGAYLHAFLHFELCAYHVMCCTPWSPTKTCRVAKCAPERRTGNWWTQRTMCFPTSCSKPSLTQTEMPGGTPPEVASLAKKLRRMRFLDFYLLQRLFRSFR